MNNPIFIHESFIEESQEIEEKAISIEEEILVETKYQTLLIEMMGGLI